MPEYRALDAVLAAVPAKYADVIRALPAARVRPAVEAQWMVETTRYNHWHCSACGYVIGVMRIDSKFCPSCGANMRPSAE